MRRRELLKIAAGGALAAASTAPRLARAQGKGKVRLAYLQLGWAATEIIHKEDLLGKRGWSAEYSIVPGAPGPLLAQLASKNVDAIDMSFALAAKAFEDGVPRSSLVVSGDGETSSGGSPGQDRRVDVILGGPPAAPSS